MSGPWVDDDNVALLTDYYELTMAAGYLHDGPEGPATFELFVRRLPPERSFLVAAGLDDAVLLLEKIRFGPDEIGYLRSLDRFDERFLDHMAGFRFSGEVWAMAEGTVCFETEPLLRITAPLIEAQVVETLLLNTVGFQTLIASKAARVGIAASGRPFVDFGARRSHGADAAVRAARSCYLAGASATSIVLAGAMFGIPVAGTMAHSYVLSHPSEREAFVAFARRFPDDAVLLIDTYDTVAGARVAAQAAADLAAEGISVKGVRLDSGDLGSLASRVREILDEAGFPDIQIIASGGLDEHRVAALLNAGAPIDAFGIGTAMVISDDAPSLDIVYKMVESPQGAVMKTSTGKATLPGAHQVFRTVEQGTPTGDVIGLAAEAPLPGTPLLERRMSGGVPISNASTLAAARERCAAGIASLPDSLKQITGRPRDPYPISTSPALDDLVRRLGRSD